MMMRRIPLSLLLSLLLACAALRTIGTTSAFVPRTVQPQPRKQQSSTRSSRLFFSDDDNNNNNNNSAVDETDIVTHEKKKVSRWDQLNPKIKERLIRAGRERAIANKQKREPALAKKRRRYMFVKEQQREKKRAARVARPLPLADRAPLSALLPGMECPGVVISLTSFGAYVDVGSEVDGLLHVSQLSADGFVAHPRQVLRPGDEVTVRVRARDAEKKKLQLTMLPMEIVEEQLARQRNNNNNDGGGDDDRIALEDLAVDDELWGELKRVTNFGAYVEVGAVVDGFLHFMDHPEFGVAGGRQHVHPTELMRKGDRVRVWVSDVDLDLRRIKLTAIRPAGLPGPKRELNF